jgi:hypothetical protein
LLLTGWKNIVNYTGFSRGTILRLVKEDDFPLKYIATKPTTCETLIAEWLRDQLKKKSGPQHNKK